jgi:hypothetical protein
MTDMKCCLQETKLKWHRRSKSSDQLKIKFCFLFTLMMCVFFWFGVLSQKNNQRRSPSLQLDYERRVTVSSVTDAAPDQNVNTVFRFFCVAVADKTDGKLAKSVRSMAHFNFLARTKSWTQQTQTAQTHTKDQEDA